MKFKKTKLLSLLMVAALVFESVGMNVVAASDTVGNDAENVNIEEMLDVTAGDVTAGDVTEGNPVTVDVTEGDVSEDDVSEGNVEAPAEDVTEGDVTGGDVSEGDVTEGDSEAPEGDVTEGNVVTVDVTEGDVSEGDVEKALFPGLPKGYHFTKAQLSAKADLSAHSGEFSELSDDLEGKAYATGEVVYLTDSEEDAQLVAEAFGGELKGYAAGVAVITLAERVSVLQAVCAAGDEDTMLPAVWPNYVKQYYEFGNELYDDPALFDYNGGDYQWQHKFVGSYYAWEAGYTGAGINVAIVDSGALSSHEDLDARIKKNIAISEDGTEVSDTTTDPQGHGTHVAGIAAATIGNDAGGAGVAPNANLYIYSVGNSSGSIYSDAALRAIYMAAGDGAHVLNMSYGGAYYDGNENAMMQYAYENGVALFAAAGNDYTYNAVSYPAAYPNVCSVAALQSDGKQSDYTNTGSTVDLAFPGSAIYSTTKDGGYGYKQGTSMATPVATGVAAVILSGAADIPELAGKTGSERVDALFAIMEENAKACPSKGTGAGATYLPDVFDIFVDDWDSKLETPTFSYKTKTVFDSEYATLAIDCPNTVGTVVIYTLDGSTPSFKNGVLKNDDYYYETPIKIGGKKTVTVKAMAIDWWTGRSSKVSTATYTFKPTATSVTIVSANGVNQLLPGKSLKLTAVVTPTYAVSKKVLWSVSEQTKAAGVSVNKAGKVTVAKNAAPGTYNIFATSVDASGKIANMYDGHPVETVFPVTVLAQEATKSVKFAEKTLTVDRYDSNVTIDAAELVTVTYTDNNTKTGKEADLVWTTSSSYVARVDSSGVITAINPGKATIKTIANDGSGKVGAITVVVTQKPTDIEVYTEYGASVLAPGKSIKMYVDVEPWDTSNAKVNWSVAPVGTTTGKVSVSKAGKLSADKKASGVWKVTATTVDTDANGNHFSASMDITITAQAVKSISMEKTLDMFICGDYFDSKKLNVTIDGPADTPLYFWTDNTNVVDLYGNGWVDGWCAGTATVYCKTLDGSNKVAKCKITVKVPMSSLTIVPGDTHDGGVYVGSSIKMSTVAGTSYGIPSSTKVKWSVAPADKDKISISNSGVVKAKSLGKDASSSTNTVAATIYAEAADGSGFIASYNVTVFRKAKKALLEQYGNDLYGFAWLNNNDIITVPYSIEVTAPKGKNVGVQKGSYYFYLIPEEATTEKTDNFTKKDAIKVKVMIKLQGCNKTATKNVYIVKTQAGYVYYL